GEVRAECGERFCRRQPNAIGGTRDQDLLVVHGTAIQRYGDARVTCPMVEDPTIDHGVSEQGSRRAPASRSRARPEKAQLRAREDRQLQTSPAAAKMAAQAPGLAAIDQVSRLSDKARCDPPNKTFQGLPPLQKPVSSRGPHSSSIITSSQSWRFSGAPWQGQTNAPASLCANADAVIAGGVAPFGVGSTSGRDCEDLAAEYEFDAPC